MAFVAGGVTGSLLAFLVATIFFVALIFGVSYAVGSAQESVVSRLRTDAALVKRWGGYILVTVGGWFILLSIFAAFFSDLFPV